MSDHQQELPFNRDMQFKYMNEAISNLPSDLACKRNFISTMENLMKVLINGTIRGACWFTYEVIAYRMRCSPRTARRYMDHAVDLGWVLREERIGNGGQQSNKYIVNLAALRSGHKTGNRPGGHDDHPGGLEGHPDGRQIQPGGSEGHAFKEVLLPSTSIKPPPTNATDPWEEVEEEILGCEVAKATAVVERLRGRDVATDEVRGVLRYWRSNRDLYGPGALYTRLWNLTPRQSPGSLWPQPDADALKRRQQTLRANEERLSEMDEAAIADHFERLQADYGRHLDGLTSDQLRELIEESLLPWRQDAHRKQNHSLAAIRSSSSRLQLLEGLAMRDQRAEACVPTPTGGSSR